MATVENVIAVLNETRGDRSTSKSVSRLMEKHSVDTRRKLVNHYNRNGGLKALIGELNEQDLRKSLTVLDNKSKLQAVVYGALAFDSKLEALIPEDENQGNSRKLRGIMDELCGWHVDSFQQPTYDDLTEMLNRFGIDVEERKLEKLEKDGKKAADRKTRLLRMFAD